MILKVYQKGSRYHEYKEKGLWIREAMLDQLFTQIIVPRISEEVYL